MLKGAWHEATPEPGTVIGSRYVVDGVLGKGGMSLVLRARDSRLGHMVALKLLRSSEERLGERAQRFLREARIIARLRSDHVVGVLDVDVNASPPYLVMELLEGSTVAQLLAARGSFDPGVATRMIAQACRGVADAHALGVVHRDLKPSNLFVERDANGSQRVKVIDFGVSKCLLEQVDQPELTSSGQILGSPRYMCPEQVRSGNDLDARVDIWALGTILYELIAGVSPFDAPTTADTLARIVRDPPTPLRAYRPDVPERVAALVALCLSKDRTLRPPSALALLQELEAMTPPGPLCLDEASGWERADSALGTTDSGGKWSWAHVPRGEPVRLRRVGVLASVAAFTALCGWLGAHSLQADAPVTSPLPPPSAAVEASGPILSVSARLQPRDGQSSSQETTVRRQAEVEAAATATAADGPPRDPARSRLARPANGKAATSRDEDLALDRRE
jgi:serine/threonine-protein kinase